MSNRKDDLGIKRTRMKQKVVIIGHGYTSRLGIIRSLAELDCDVIIVTMVFHRRLGRLIRFEGGKPIDGYSKYVSKVLYCPFQDAESLISLIIEKCSDSHQKPIIIPDSDFSASVIDWHQDRLKDYFLFPHINHSPGAVEYWMDKINQKELAKEVGLRVASGVVVDVSGNRYTFPDHVQYPCFTKALATVSGGKQFLRKCENADELKKVLDKVAMRYDTKVLIEEFKNIHKEYAVVGFSNGQEVVIPGVIEFVENCKSHFGIAREGKVIPLSGFESIVALFKVFIQRIGFSGLFDIDFYESEGELFFSELNLRFGGSGYAITKMGVNLPVMLVNHLLGKENKESYSLTINDTSSFINERMCLDDYIAGYLSEKEFWSIINASPIKFVYDDADRAPYARFKRFCHLQRINRFRRALKKKLKG